MPPKIITKKENARLCGYRKKKGIYLISDGLAAPCDKLPVPLCACPTCGGGIKQARGFTWIDSKLFQTKYCSGDCQSCPFNDKDKKWGLLWVGQKFYSTPNAFTHEAKVMGVSKKIGRVPYDLKIGETWIALAHPHAIVTVSGKDIIKQAGIFHAFRPTRIEYVVTGRETEKDLLALEKRGFTLVNVEPAGKVEQKNIF
jgi:hypothetical protein